MSMSKKDFIALADKIKFANEFCSSPAFTEFAINRLADFCQTQNPAFKRDRWLAYISGECGPNGGAVKKPSQSSSY